MSLSAPLAEKEILVVCGAGGVGKTSVAAALALEASRTRRTIVLTIDPARRLAAALGLEGAIGHEATPVTPTFDAAMLDMRTAWDEFVDRNAPSPKVADSIRSNRLYQGLSQHFVGSQPYMAMERLADLYERSDYDLIVIDTPPSHRALDFLDAPKRMTDFLGGSLLRWFAMPYAAAGRLGARAFSLTASPLLRIADRVLGSQVLEDLSSFVLDFQSLYGAFKARAAHVLRLLHSPESGFVVVTTLDEPVVLEAAFLLDRLNDERLPMAGVVANRVIPARFAGTRPLVEAMRSADAGRVATAAGIAAADARAALDAAGEVLADLEAAAVHDEGRVRDLERRGRLPVTVVPMLSGDVHDLVSLSVLGGWLADG